MLLLTLQLAYAELPVVIREDVAPSFSDAEDFTEVTHTSTEGLVLDLETTYLRFRARFFAFLAAEKVTQTYNCWEDATLEIRHLSQEELNQLKPAAFKDVYLWGLFEPPEFGSKEPYRIFYTSPEHDASQAPVVLAHELFHFWYKKYCVFMSLGAGDADEPLAQKFETFALVKDPAPATPNRKEAP